MRRRSDAFTLIETLLALAILAGAAATMLVIRANALRNATSAHNRLVATRLAREALAQAALNPDAALPMETRPSDQPGFVCRYIGGEKSLGALGSARSLRVEVSFPAAGTGEETVALETLMAPAARSTP